MRNVSSAITNAETGPALRPTHALTARNELLSFAAPTMQTNASLDVEVPPCFVLRASGNIGYATYRHTNGTHYIRVVDVTAPGDFALSASGATAIGTSGTMYAMRSGMITDAGTTYLYTAYPESGQIRVRRATLTSTSNPPSVSFANYGPLFGSALTDSTTFVRRVEAVCPTLDGVIVAVGEHSFSGGLSTITFFWLPSTSVAVQLNAIVQMPLSDGYTNWYTHARYCTYIAAASDGAGRICVVANSLADGRAVMFTVQAGIESELAPVVPMDIESRNAYFAATAIAKIGNLYHMAGRMTRRNSDGSAFGYDCYLTSDDLVHWSLGERNHYLVNQRGSGTLLYPSGGSTVYYVGALLHTSAPATYAQNPALGTLDLTSKIMSWNADQGTNRADTMECELANADGALTGSSVLKRGATLVLRTGQEGTLADFAVYGADSIDEQVTTSGREAMRVRARDIAGKRLADWKCPVDAWLESISYLQSQMTGPDGLIVKTARDRGYTFSSGGKLTYTGLNDPLIAYVDADHTDSSLTKALVRFSVSNDYHLSSFGVLVGSADDGTGHVVLIPKAHSWPGYTRPGPKIRRLALPAIDPNDPDKADAGFNLKARTNSIWVQSGNGALRTSAVVGGQERTAAAWQAAVGSDYDIAVRTAGRRVQVYTKVNNYTPGGTSANAGWTLQYEYLFDWRDRMRPTKRAYGGIVLCTDVFVNTDAFAQAVHDDIEVQLTDADNTVSFWTLLTTGQKNLGHVDRILNVASTAGLNVDMYIHARVPGQHTGIHRITGITGNTVFISPNLGAGIPDGTTVEIYGQDAGDEAGYASSGQTKKVQGGTDVITNPKAEKTPRLVYGRAFFVSEDNTAGLNRFIATDGVRHVLRQISGTTKVGWDLTNPIPATNTAVGSAYPNGLQHFSSGSDPVVWKMIFHHGYWFSGPPSAYGLPDNLPAQQYFLVDDEICRYARTTFTRRGGGSVTWTVIPTYYAPLAAAAAGTTQLRNWRASGGQQPGDDFGDIPNAAGLLVEVSGRNRINRAEAKQYYVQSVTKITNPSPSNTSYITLTTAYEPPVNGVDPNTLQGYGDVCIVSGRGQFGSKKTSHAPDAPVVYYPCDSQGNPASIRVSRLDYYAGRYLSVQDAIRRIAALAGQRDVTFRTQFTTTTGAYAFTAGTSPTPLPLHENIANFVLDLNAVIHATARLYVEFRNYYRLSVRYFATGRIQVGLQTTSTDISADGNGDRWLEYVTVPVSDHDFANTYCDVRLVANDATVVVEVNRQPLWTFNLSHYTDGTNNYKRTTTGPIRVYYSSSIGANTTSALVQELGDPVDGFALRKTQTARAAIDDLVKDRHIKSRATASGGIEFAQFRTRDNAGELRKNLLKDEWQLDDARNAGHVLIIGDNASGETIDDAMLRAEGYRFDAGDNRRAVIASQCRMEARLWLRDQRETRNMRSVSGYGRIAPQPEDRVTLVYSPGGDVPSKAASDHVIEEIELRADEKSVKGTYVLRDYVSTL